MKAIYSVLFASLLSLLLVPAFAQTAQLPSVEVEDLRGRKVNIQSLTNEGKPIIISFWATWCKPCIQELKLIDELYPDWQEETGVKLVAISIDDTRTSNLVRSFTMGQGWEYEIYLDVNSDMKRAMNVVNVPHTFLLDGEGKIVYQHNSYASGDEEILYEHVKELLKAKKSAH